MLRTPSTTSSQTGNDTFTARNLLIVTAVIALLYVFAHPSSSHQLSFLASPRLPCAEPPSTADPTLQPPAREVKVLITGGAGYIGSHMALLLLIQTDVRYSIVAVDDLSRGDMRHIRTLQALAAELGKSYTFIESDIGSVSTMVAAFTAHSIELVIHFAGYAYASESVAYPLKYFENIVTKTQQLLAAMSEAGVRRLVYSSSSATYGSITNERCDSPLHEWSPQKPLSPYGTSKLMAEQVVLAYANSKHVKGEMFSAVMLRYFNVIGSDPLLRVGPMPKKHLANYGRIVDSCFDAAISGQPMKLFGDDYPTKDGSPIRDYIHVMDLVDAHLQLTQVVHDRQVEAYNIGIGAGFSVKELVAACQLATGKTVRTTIQPRRSGDPAVVMGDPSKLMRQLGWKPKFTDLTESIKTAWKWRQLVENEEALAQTQEATPAPATVV
jgi:UDP-arabinose 4-epimerase